MQTLLFLILFPILVACLLLFVKRTTLRYAVVALSALAIGGASIYLLMRYAFAGAVYFAAPSEAASLAMVAIEMVLALFIIYMGAKFRNYLAIALAVVQAALIVYLEMTFPENLHAANNLFIDQFSIIMALIIGIIGSLIAVYAVRYMETYHHHHPEVRDRQKMFFFVIFAFLAAMFGLVFSNNLMWVFFFWEITTISSFLLIGYSETDEATRNAFRALVMNLLGGVAFVAAIIYLAAEPASGGIDLARVLASGDTAVILIPAVLIGFAGITKAALMPFSSWLLGAMVAPTPVSALLHSSTMVKAGVYILVRFAPVFAGTFAGFSVGLVGAVTFVVASAIAISQSNAKLVLAYSTIANLGLIAACAGVGTHMLVWAAILLIIFHAVAKSLLFLGTGAIEHRTGSRDIEDMEGLIVRMPKMAVMMFIGIAGMFLAPFGMLVSKWAAIEAFVQVPFGLVFVAILAYGSAVTVFFWAKWMGKLVTVTRETERIEKGFLEEPWAPLYIITGLVIAAVFLFPVISSTLIEPYVLAIYGITTGLAQTNVAIMLLMMALLLILPVSFFLFRRTAKHLPAYMGGRPATPDLHFAGSLGMTREAQTRNYYLTDYFGEARLFRPGAVVCIVLILASWVLAGVAL
ncbi:NADH-quinone oxidoreductase subunit L [Methanoculleus bourgensis]|uniref:NADH dehydrogenase (Quinone) n=4 Tax=Methanoculleus bourgensis TaxID=83986 RepID=I7J967_METBM|nr:MULTISPECIES: proton-conducting transporter membrane subunit [Methanoculleus]MBT0733972.1 NADH-quinone oxidoreductase subunit L [Methanoculleus bourgensis]MDD3373847.1 proton-conducting transporter membrane subunit [Methanoculleus bourgensis]CCJ36458.1 NADH dehydrogenase (quinone) [Methanoculleus bourgensis MS2]CVK33184.1 NADH dehydrogenase (Quinone) [Methanoculleus bourgensis]